jgi:peptidoglycan/LPS O-acetylase OafA/YrhL
MDAETLLGTLLIAAWAAVVLRGLARTAIAARKGRQWERAYLVGLGVGCALGVGVVLSIKNSLPLDSFGLSFFLAAGAACAIWAFGRRVPTGKRKGVRAKRQTERAGEDGLGLRSTE